jgi:hypothetical protein
VSRLASRIGRLEQSLGPCPVCANRAPPIELIQATAAANDRPADSRCPACGDSLEQITVLLAFDPNLGDDRLADATRADQA